ncbi:MAG: Hsp70 family protein, partial [Thiotrichaceae bacterium]|nr:Hsp70 family protein [Thiotrichaceae bacterium]
EVTFDIDANGIMHVTAKDKGTNKEQNIRIEASSGLTDEEIEKMKQEAEANADADKLEKEKVEKLNAADSMIFQTEKQLKEFGDKISDANKTPITEALENLKKVHEAQDLEGIDAALEAINKAWEGASQEMYAASQEAGGEQAGPDAGAAGGTDAPGGDDVSDVEFEEVEEEAKEDDKK